MTTFSLLPSPQQTDRRATRHWHASTSLQSEFGTSIPTRTRQIRMGESSRWHTKYIRESYTQNKKFSMRAHTFGQSNATCEYVCGPIGDTKMIVVSRRAITRLNRTRSYQKRNIPATSEIVIDHNGSRWRNDGSGQDTRMITHITQRESFLAPWLVTLTLSKYACRKVYIFVYDSTTFDSEES